MTKHSITEGAMMGESTTASAKRTRAAGGLRLERVWTTEGMHPFDEVTWERRDVVMTNWRDGSINFEQRGVEFPDFWSVNATNIVTTKYFRGAVGTPEREWSLKQLIGRVVESYRAAGEKYGYFATSADAEIFEHELAWMLLHQVFSFNSPVWFNVGTASPQQVSACLPFHSLVSTPSGLIPIGQLVQENAVGTKVYDAQGVTRIVAVKANGVREVIRLHTKAGYTIDVTPDHQVWKASGHDSGKFVEAGTLLPGDQLEWHRRDAYGEAPLDLVECAEAALAGWLQSDGFVGQYEGTNRSLTIEAMTVTDAELAWVTRHLDAVLPGAHRREVLVPTMDTALDCHRTRLYGKVLEPFVEKWGLRARGTAMTVPAQLYTAPLPVVANYLRSIFQAEGYVSRREASTLISVDMISEQLIRGVQRLLLRFGIFSRVSFKADKRADRHGVWTVRVQTAGDRRIFADEIGFIDPVKQGKVEASFDQPGLRAAASKRLEIKSVERLGAMEVYDIQTESGEFLTDNIRVHNCFILSVDDSIDSIMDWYKEEGLIFKGGSGSGINLSRIRSSKELLSSGGTASGPVSFMRGADASAGTIKSGGATRRAAKMVILDVDHPDVEDFIVTKAREEDKIRALRDAGFDMDLGGNDIVSVQYQNANNSVRVSNEFMEAVREGKSFDLLARLDGGVIKTVDAKELFRKLAQAAWECADPGIQYDDTINRWHTCSETGRITASNPCSEYLHLDDTSCNLASLNLMKFLGTDSSFNITQFVKSVELVITAMDISISFADFPTQKITENTRAYRQLGIGYANLGALLMASGLPYDSDAGRSVAASITALMTGVAYRRSAELAGVVGAYDGYARNEKPHKKVMNLHAEAAQALKPHGPVATAVVKEAQKQWQAGNKLGDKQGWRNAQASVLAPTGTIGFMMDCDTTGVEPDLALVKFKKLVGGGSMQIVNQTVPRALRTLGYQEEQIEAITEFIATNGHVVDAPGLRQEHYAVFDCAMGERAIAPMGHVLMMAAVQPFISGAISKTVNMPESATVEEVEKMYYDGWTLGLKALAIYRDNCKVGQPLSIAKKETPAATADKTAEKAVEKVIEYRPVRKRLPKKRNGQTVSFAVGDAEGYLTASSYPDDGLGEVFLKLGKQGSTLAGVMDAFSIAVSVALQYGVPLRTYVEKFMNMKFEPAGMTDDPDIRIANSVMDYIFRRLALDYLTYEQRAELGVFTAAERAARLAAEEAGVDYVPSSAQVASPQGPVERVGSSTEALEALMGKASDAPLCYTCGTKMRPAGSCYVCEGCGSTSGCS
jgi:ribonucleoside-diphosphate reductase alpha chain